MKVKQDNQCIHDYTQTTYCDTKTTLLLYAKENKLRSDRWIFYGYFMPLSTHCCSPFFFFVFATLKHMLKLFFLAASITQAFDHGKQIL